MEKTAIELFAGVGGFRVGLNKIKEVNDDGIAVENQLFEIVWANQWEPSTKTQHAFDCYKKRFNCNIYECSNEDISQVKKEDIPPHSLLCGGFPCQDYSVARSLKNEKGIEGKKGVLWWQIDEILATKNPPFVLLENVDRLIKSPSKQRGQAFGIMLRCFSEKGYSVEWRVINAAQYGHVQRRRRTFIFAFKNTTNHYKRMITIEPLNVIQAQGIFAIRFPIQEINSKIREYEINDYIDLLEVSEKFEAKFENSGYMLNGHIYTCKSQPIEIEHSNLSNIIDSNIDESFYLNDTQIKKFEYLRKDKKVLRKRKSDGGEYFYSEGKMSPYDALDLPGRTMLTSESTTNRSTHIIRDPQSKRLRFLTPIECERLNEFPINWTSGMSNRKRYFMMGNALVCGIVSKLGDEISLIIDKE